MILSDTEIIALCEQGMIDPFDPKLVNPASLDVRLGSQLLIESVESPKLVPLDLEGFTQERPYLWAPQSFALAPTLETFNMPNHVAGEFRLKSSRAREGFDQALAVWLDPGWCGSVLTMELRNNRRLHPVAIWPGMKIGQVVLHRMSEPPLRSYAVTGRYNNDTTVQESKG